MTAEIIAVGTELLLGDIVNTNAAFLARELAALGFDLFHQSVVGDNRARLSESIRTALARSDLVVLCGGLGPTEDDLTRETAAETLGVPLVHDAAVQSTIDAYFVGRHMCETANNRRQAMILAGGRVLANPNGTAPGQLLQKDGRTLALLPGPPNEFCPMVTGTLCPLLAGLTGSTIHSRTLRVFGIGEADLEYHLRDELQSANPTAACYCKPGEVHLRITAKAATEAEAEALVEQKAAVLRSRIGDRIYSECGRSLPETVVDLLRERQLTVTVAESITGGGIAADITSVPGASEVFSCGYVTYSEEAKRRQLGVRAETLERYTAVSEQTAREMAEGALARSGADIAAAATGYAGPDGAQVGLVYVAVCYRGQTAVRRLTLGSLRSREYLRELTRKNAFDMLRRALLGLGGLA